MDEAKAIDAAKEQFGKVLKEQLQRIERIKGQSERRNYTKLDRIVVGMLGGEGIGPFIAEADQRVRDVGRKGGWRRRRPVIRDSPPIPSCRTNCRS